MRQKLTKGQKAVVTTIKRHGAGCYRRWGKSAWQPRTRRKSHGKGGKP